MIRSATSILMLFASSLIGCASPGDGETAEMLELRSEFRNEMREMKRELLVVQNELKNMRGRLRDDSTADKNKQNAPITNAVFRPDGSHLDDPFLGPKDSPIIIMAFSDYQCTPCRKFARKTLQLIKNEFIDTEQIKFILRDYPLATREHSFQAAALAHCAGEQGQYWEMHDLLFSRPAELDAGNFEEFIDFFEDLDRERLKRCAESTRYKKEIEADIRDGQQLGAKGAPGFFIGVERVDSNFHGVFVRGAQPFPVLKSQIRKALATLK